MCLIALLEEVGIQSKRTAGTNGGEYKSACPNCKDGKDRFCIWPNQTGGGRYWCRICGASGDEIQFCRDFIGLSYIDACKKLKTEPRKAFSVVKGENPFKKQSFNPQTIPSVSETWQKRAVKYIDYCHKQLLDNPMAMSVLSDRGVTPQTIAAFHLGWNPQNIFDSRVSWGLPLEYNQNGNERKQWLPQGIVIPSYENQAPTKIKVRRSDWHDDDELPKYVEVSGSFKRLAVYGDTSKPIVVMESELDAILIQQYAADLCCCVALGGVGKRPDACLHDFLRLAPQILLALDYDEAGKREYPFWMSLYSNLRPWPASKGKSPGDAHKLYSADLRRWVKDGFRIA